MLPFDLGPMLADTLDATNRAPDGKLHPSGDIVGSLRHTQLHAAGAPTLPEDIGSRLRLLAGTAIHDYFEHQVLRGKLVMTEVKLDDYLPEGWSGTADWVAWDDERRAFVLGDLKTIKAGGINRIIKEGVKEAHLWQISAYFHALVRAGLPMVNGAAIYYVPLGQLTASEGSKVEPTLQEITPIPEAAVIQKMAQIRADVDNYLASLTGLATRTPMSFITPELAPVQERVLKYTLNKRLKVPAIDVMRAPHWSTAYCPFPDELCNCRHQTANKVGQFNIDPDTDALVYKGDEARPDDPAAAQIAALRKVLDGAEG